MKRWKMNRRTSPLAIVACLIATSLPTVNIKARAIETETKPTAAAAEENKSKENPAHEELRALRMGLVEAIKKNDIDDLLTYLDPDVVVIWQNGEVSRKPDGVKAYYERMMKGPQRVVDSLTIDPTVDELTHLYGDTGVAFGSSKDHYKLADGKDFELLSHWTATVVKKDGTWKIAAFHSSANMFDNAVLRLAVFRVSSWTGGIALIVGLVVGVVLAKIFRKRSPASGAANAVR
jgi:ketosteroid isomerase-like protein